MGSSLHKDGSTVVYRLRLEDHADRLPASLGEVQKAVSKLAISEGQAFLTLIEENGSRARAGGPNGRYRVEAMHVHGESSRPRRECTRFFAS